MIEEYIGGDTACFFGVFDGHGAEGAKISQHLKHNLPRDLSEAIQWRVSLPAFEAAQNLLHVHPGQKAASNFVAVMHVGWLTICQAQGSK